MAVSRKHIKVGQVSVYDTNLIYSRVLSQKKRDISLKDILKFDLTPVPPSMFEENGDLRTTKKTKAVIKKTQSRNIGSNLPQSYLNHHWWVCSVLGNAVANQGRTVDDFVWNLLVYVKEHLTCDLIMVQPYQNVHRHQGYSSDTWPVNLLGSDSTCAHGVWHCLILMGHRQRYCGEQIEGRLPVEEIRWPRNIYIGCYFISNVLICWMLRVNGQRLLYFLLFCLRRWEKRSLQPQSSNIFHRPQLLSVYVYTGHIYKLQYDMLRWKLTNQWLNSYHVLNPQISSQPRWCTENDQVWMQLNTTLCNGQMQLFRSCSVFCGCHGAEDSCNEHTQSSTLPDKGKNEWTEVLGAHNSLF